MSKSQSKSKLTAKPEAKASFAVSSTQGIPNRTLGLSIMCVLIVFVALLMNRQSQQREINTLSTSNVMDLAGFQSRFWYLPDDPLWCFVKIPGGDFLMGSNPAQDRMAYANERW